MFMALDKRSNDYRLFHPSLEKRSAVLFHLSDISIWGGGVFGALGKRPNDYRLEMVQTIIV